jgi:N6-L-threonylcarbamoyladenine synthase
MTPDQQFILGIETSCDDTSVAVLGPTGAVLSLVSQNQDRFHEVFGGVVPEIASRNHLMTLLPLCEFALKEASISASQLSAVAVTNRPGLLGSLIVGVVVAKTLAQSLEIPLIGVNHLEGHILAPFVSDATYTAPEIRFPFLAIAVSGGHTNLYLVRDFGSYEILGSTADDAAGEAFDKFGKMLGLGFPGGVEVDRLSRQGNPNAYNFPRPLLHEETFAMSFSGLKSAAARKLTELGPEMVVTEKANLCASFQEAIVDILLSKIQLAQKKFSVNRIVLTGGVSANSRLREKAKEWALKRNIELLLPPLKFCTDNAAMIAYAGFQKLRLGRVDDLNLHPSAGNSPGDFLEPL